LRRTLCLVALILALVPTVAAGQAAPSDRRPPDEARSTSHQATVRGTVLDPMRAPIAGARVTATPEGGSAAASAATTDERGAFSLELEPGAYTMTVVANGFVEISRPLAVTSAQPAAVDVLLAVAGFTTDVTVSAPGGYQATATTTAMKTPTALRDVPQSVTVVTKDLIKDQLMMSVSDVVRYVPGIASHQGENNRDQIVVRGNNSSADFFLDGVRDDVQYYRDLYNVDRLEALKGPNAMIFGRGGGGGVLNRVTKQAGPQPIREFTLQGGGFQNKRFTTDLDQPLGDKAFFRVNGMVESSDSFRSSVDLDRYAVNPTVTLAPAARTKVFLGYEFLHDGRVADRGIPSFQGRPLDTDISTYFGNPDNSRVRATVNLASAAVEHRTVNGLVIRNRTLVGDYDRSYQNFVPGAVSADRTSAALTAYNNATSRLNLFNQTDVVSTLSTGGFRHTLLAGAEFGRQLTDNFRNTGFFNNTAPSITVPLASTIITTPVTFRQSATDADNHLRTNVAAVYAQDQLELTRAVQLVGGLRFDRFDLSYHNNRTGDTLTRPDNLVSPRAGVVVKPVTPLSVYSSFSVSYLPSSGDQFSSLTTVTQQVKPEQFTNYEVGAKWDLRPELSLTSAVYRLDRTNTRSTDPNDPTRIVQTGAQRTNGYEIEVNGRVMPAWKIAGGYTYQDAFVTSGTAAGAVAGATVGLVPHHTFALWNQYQFHPRLAAALGLYRRSDMYAAIDDTVTLPGYLRADAAAFFTLTRSLRLQGNVENVFDKRYFANADSNTNISPGFPRTLRVALNARF
jgi:catecholate siderophore receptor